MHSPGFKDGAETSVVHKPKKSHLLYQLFSPLIPQSGQQLASVELCFTDGPVVLKIVDDLKVPFSQHVCIGFQSSRS